MYQQFVNFLEAQLKNPLPGFEAQKLMSPLNKKAIYDYSTELKSAKEAATMLLFFPDENNIPNFVLTKRLEYQGVHSGQISLPGGKKEPTDINFEYAAIRETNEEIGIDANKIKVLGKLSELYIPPSNFLVYPFLSVAFETPKFIPQENEVFKIIEVPYFLLNDMELRKEKKVQLSGSNLFVNAPYFDFFGHEVWGATAMMLSETAEILRGFEMR